MSPVHGPRRFLAPALLAFLAGVASCLGSDPERVDTDDSADGGIDGDGQDAGTSDAATSDAPAIAPGTLDDTYAAGPIALSLDTARAAAFDDLGRLYIAGMHACAGDGGTTTCFAVIRLQPNGAVDPTFGDQGRVTHRVATASAPFYRDGAWSIAVDRDRLVLGGESNRHPATGNFGKATLLTLATDGSLDRAPSVFEATGVVWWLAKEEGSTDYHAMYGSVSRALREDTTLHGGAALALYSRDANVQLLGTELTTGLPSIAGSVYASIDKSDYVYVTGMTSDRRLGVGRLHASGDVDVGWAGSGFAKISVGDGDSEGHGIAVLADGRLIVSGASGIDPGGTGFGIHRGPLTLVRLSANGQKDVTYGNVSMTGGGAFVSPALKREASNYEDPEVVIDAQGRAVVSGLADADVVAESSAALTRVMPDGRPDESFGQSATVRCGPAKDSVPVAVLRDSASGKLLLVARRQSEVYVCRYHP